MKLIVTSSKKFLDLKEGPKKGRKVITATQEWYDSGPALLKKHYVQKPKGILVKTHRFVPTAKNYMAENINSADIEIECSKLIILIILIFFF